MKAHFYLLTTLLVTLPALSSDFMQKGTITDLLACEPDGYAVLDTVTGDLNRDDYRDMIIVYKQTAEEDSSDVTDPALRPLLIYTGNQTDSLALVARNDKAVYCYHCGGVFGDPFSRIVIKNGYFTVEHYGGSNWRWTRFVTFKYSSRDSTWHLHRDGGESYHTSDPDKVTETMKTVKDFGTVAFEEFDIYKEEE
ncbi:MAG: hypothetical protein ACOCW2_01860 [Chitinivibrionales bacterium]